MGQQEKTSDKTQDKAQQFRGSDFSQHSTDLREKAAAIGHNVQEMGKITKELASETMEFLGENAKGYYREGIQGARRLEKNMEGHIRENPVKSLLIAAGIGLVLGALWRRR